MICIIFSLKHGREVPLYVHVPVVHASFMLTAYTMHAFILFIATIFIEPFTVAAEKACSVETIYA